MSFELSAKDYTEYLELTYTRIHEQGDYITSLDAATGDGDHWVNVDSGLRKVVDAIPEISTMSLSDEFKKIGMILMSVIGGSSGVLLGSSYIEASKTLVGKEKIANEDLCGILEGMLNGITKRGGAVPGMKTMIDSLEPAVKKYQECLKEKVSIEDTLTQVKQAALDGAESTKNMEAIRGRASYQANKGLGCLDPGAVSMSLMIETMMDYALTKNK